MLPGRTKTMYFQYFGSEITFIFVLTLASNFNEYKTPRKSKVPQISMIY